MENLGIDPKLLLAQVINFVLFFFIFKKYITKPFQLFLKNEANKEAEKDRLLKKAKEDEEKLSAKQIDLEKKSKKLEKEILEKARIEAKKIKDSMLEEAKLEIISLKKSAEKSVAADQNKYKEERERKVADMTTKVVKSLMGGYLSEDQSRVITGSMLNNLSHELKKYEN